jgi:hypothetical protein
MPLDLARIGARAFAVQTLDGALNQRREILRRLVRVKASAKNAPSPSPSPSPPARA